ncbi:MAG: hypothetical protein H7288_06805 [Kineosporiaceae bacterium]|nr:hypothetical protein [Aeromicrobium sp.]
MDLLGIINSIAVTGALLAAIWQLRESNKSARTRDESQRTERALALYRDLVAEGPAAEAFHRLSVYLRREGSMTAGRTSWRLLKNSDLDAGGLLDPSAPDKQQLFADLYTILWFFERTEISRASKIVNPELLMRTLGFHFWWWGQILVDLDAPKASGSIHALSIIAQEWAIETKNLDIWRSSCTFDFDGGPGKTQLQSSVDDLNLVVNP